MNKKNFEIVLLQSISRVKEQLLSVSRKAEDLIITEFNDQKFLKFIDSDKESEFKFEILTAYLSMSIPVFKIEISPSSTTTNVKSTKVYREKEVIDLFESWISWLKIYENTHLTPEDEILKHYEKEYYSEFEIIDENAEIEPFSTEQQFLLNNLLVDSIKKIELLKLEKNETEVVDLDEILSEAEAVKKALTRESKKKVIRKLSKFLSKTRRFGGELIKGVIIEFTSELFKRNLLG